MVGHQQQRLARGCDGRAATQQGEAQGATFNAWLQANGGYSGNPTITPLVRECASKDTILVQINPVERQELPRSARDILELMELSSVADTAARHLPQGLLRLLGIAMGLNQIGRAHV